MTGVTEPDDLVAMLRAVWLERRDDVLRRVDALEDALVAGLAGALGDEQRDAARRDAHTLAGAAGTFGFAAASRIARELERALDAAGPPAPSDLPRLCDLVVALRRELEAEPGAAGGTAPGDGAGSGEADAVVVADAALARPLAAAARARGLGVATAGDAAAGELLLDGARDALVLVDLGLAAALELVAGAAGAHTVLAIADPAGAVDRVDVARARAHGFAERDADPGDLVGWGLELRERRRDGDAATVLALDDDAALLDAVRAVLEAGGHRVETETDPAALLDAIDRHRPDLVLLDIELPGADGVDLCRTIRADRRWGALPVVFLTARGDPETVRRVFAAGADDFVRKPFAGPELLARVGGRLERTRLLRAHAEVDALTGLLNRRRGTERLQELVAAAADRGDEVAVALVDVHGLREVNRALGHRAGDEALLRVADLLREQVAGDDVAARWSGDELLVARYGMSEAQGRQLAGELVEAAREARIGVAGGRPLALSAGTAAFPGDGDGAEAVLQRAEEALDAAKRAGRDRVVGAGRAGATTGGDAEDPSRVDVALVEDDDLLGELLEHGLRTRGYRVRWIRDGGDAVRLLAADGASVRASVVVLDWDLPGLDGIRVLRALREHGRLADTRVVMLSARASEAEVLRAFEGGAVDHVAKPFSVPVLLQRIRRAMER